MRNLHCDKCGATLCEICGRDITENEAEDGYKRANIGGGSRLVHKSCLKEAKKDKQTKSGTESSRKSDVEKSMNSNTEGDR